jgi:sugar phosphate isomerase/epimerase
MRTADGFAQLADQMNDAGATLRDAGLTLYYHNHAFEFESLDNGQRGLDILLSRTDPACVALEMDLGWAWVGTNGADVIEVVRPYLDRIALLHVKDVRRPPAEAKLTEVGSGDVDYGRIIPAAADWPAKWLIVEQDDGWINDDPIEAVRISYEAVARFVA